MLEDVTSRLIILLIFFFFYLKKLKIITYVVPHDIVIVVTV